MTSVLQRITQALVAKSRVRPLESGPLSQFDAYRFELLHEGRKTPKQTFGHLEQPAISALTACAVLEIGAIRPRRVSIPAVFEAGTTRFDSPDGLRASEHLDLGLLQIDQALQVVGSNLPIELQRRARQTDGAQGLAAQLRHGFDHE
jgi:hypothetical protein